MALRTFTLCGVSACALALASGAASAQSTPDLPQAGPDSANAMRGYDQFAQLTLPVAGQINTGDADELDFEGAGEVFETDTVYLQADELRNDAEEGRYVARGNVEARQGGRVVRAEEAYYYPEAGRLVVNGNVVIIEANGVVEYAESADLSDNLDNGVAVNFGLRLPNDAAAAASYVERRNGTQNILTRAVYTACPVCAEDPTPTWRIRARKALQDTEEEMIYYRDVTFEVAGVPIIYSPFFAHPDPAVERKTGFLLPAIGYSTITGMRLQAPYFWAIGDSHDLTIEPIIMSEVSPVLGLTYRKRFHSGYMELTGTATHEQMFDSSGVKFGDKELRGHIYGSGVFAISEDWTWGFGLERVTDPEYLRRYDLDDTRTRRGLYRAERQRLISQVFVAGQNETFYSGAAIADFQGLSANSDDGTLPMLLPIAEYRKTLDFDTFGRVEARTDLASLQREDGVDYLRATSLADWRARYVTNFGLVMEPFARARSDLYRISDAFDPATGEEKDGGASRASGYAGFDLSMPFYRPGRFELLFEPKAQLVASAGDNTALDDFATGFSGGDPIFVQEDGLTVDLDSSNLFTPDKYYGFDLIEQGFRANVGANLRAQLGNRNSAGLFVGRSYHAEPEIFSRSSGMSQEWSDYVVEADVETQMLRLITRIRLDPDDYDIQRVDTEGRFRVGPASVSGSYFKTNAESIGGAPSEYVKGSVSLSITDHISAAVSSEIDLERDRTRQTRFTLRYQDDCLRAEIRFTDDNSSDGNIGPYESVTLYFTLRTLGGFNSR